MSCFSCFGSPFFLKLIQSLQNLLLILESFTFIWYPIIKNNLLEGCNMPKRWSVNEDIIICKYCIENRWAYSSDVDIENMMKLLGDIGCSIRSYGAIRKRAYAYEVLIEGYELPNTSKQVQKIYSELENKNIYSNWQERIKSYINEIYNPNECKKQSNIVSDNQSNLIENTNDLLGYQYTIDYSLTFPMVLQKYLDLKGIKKYNAMCKKIGMKPDTFSAILRKKYKDVKKENILKICIGLELNLKEADELLNSAGYALSNGDMTDVIIKAFLYDRRYSVVAINAELYENKAPMLFKDYVIEYEELLNS